MSKGCPWALGVSMWRCTLDVEFDKKNCFLLAEGPPGKSGTETMEGRKSKSIIGGSVTMGSRVCSQYLFLSKIRSGCRDVLELMTFGPSYFQM